MCKHLVSALLVGLSIHKAVTLSYLTYFSLVRHFCKAKGLDRSGNATVVMTAGFLRILFSDLNSPCRELLSLTPLSNRRLQDMANLFFIKVVTSLDIFHNFNA